MKHINDTIIRNVALVLVLIATALCIFIASTLYSTQLSRTGPFQDLNRMSDERVLLDHKRDDKMIYIGIIACGEEANLEIGYLLKSILLFTTSVDLIDFSIIIDRKSGPSINKIFYQHIRSPKISINYHYHILNNATISKYQHRVKTSIKYDFESHHSKIYGTLKLFFHEFFPHLKDKKYILLDTDMLVMSDLFILYQKHLVYNGDQDVIWRFAEQKEKNGMMNTGVFLFDYVKFEKIIGDKYDEYLLSALPKHSCWMDTNISKYLYQCKYADQSILNGLRELKPNLFKTIPFEWNLNGCEGFRGLYKEEEKERAQYPGIMHYNCNFKTKLSFDKWDKTDFVRFVKNYEWKWFNYGNKRVYTYIV